ERPHARGLGQAPGERLGGGRRPGDRGGRPREVGLAVRDRLERVQREGGGAAVASEGVEPAGAARVADEGEAGEGLRNGGGGLGDRRVRHAEEDGRGAGGGEGGEVAPVERDVCPAEA